MIYLTDMFRQSNVQPLSEDDDEEPSEQNTEELIGDLSVSRVHFQFRRLQDGDIPKNTKVTAIPEHKLVMHSKIILFRIILLLLLILSTS